MRLDGTDDFLSGRLGAEKLSSPLSIYLFLKTNATFLFICNNSKVIECHEHTAIAIVGISDAAGWPPSKWKEFICKEYN